MISQEVRKECPCTEAPKAAYIVIRMGIHAEITERSAFRKRSDAYMELHAFERMAHSVDPVLLRQSEDDCGNELMPQPQTRFPSDTPIGMAYVPFQQWTEVYDADKGFSRGTMFPELDMPFMGGGCAE